MHSAKVDLLGFLLTLVLALPSSIRAEQDYPDEVLHALHTAGGAYHAWIGDVVWQGTADEFFFEDQANAWANLSGRIRRIEERQQGSAADTIMLLMDLASKGGADLLPLYAWWAEHGENEHVREAATRIAAELQAGDAAAPSDGTAALPKLEIPASAQAGLQHTSPPEATLLEGAPGIPAIEYVEAGSGTSMILVHGYGSSLVTWRGVLPGLAGHFRVIAYNTLGMGRSDNPYEDYSVDAYVAQLSSLMDRLGIERATLVGHSMGGQIALAFAALHPERVEGVGLIAPSGGPRVSPTFFETAGWIDAFTAMPHGAGTTSFVRQVLQEVYLDDALVDEALVAAYDAQWRSDAGREALRRSMHEFSLEYPPLTYRQWLAAGAILGQEAPAHRGLVLWGSDDPWLPLRNAPLWGSTLQGAQVAVVPESGHLPHAEQPEAVTAALLQAFGGERGPSIDTSGDDARLKNWAAYYLWSREGLASLALGRLTEPWATTALVSTLYDEPDSPYARRGLAAQGAEAYPAMVKLLGASKTATRQVAVELLEELGDHRALEPLLALQLDADLWTSGCAATGHLGAAGTEALLGMLGSQEPRQRQCAAIGLGHSEDARAVEPLLAAMKDSSTPVQVYAAVALGQLHAQEARRPTLKLWEASSESIRGRLVPALVAFGDPRDQALLVSSLLDSAYAPLRQAAASALLDLGSPALDSLLSQLEARASGPLSPELIRVLATVADARAVALLCRDLRASQAQDQYDIAHALAETSVPVATGTLLELLSSQEPLLRQYGAQGLGRIGDARAVPALREGLTSGDVSLRAACATALGRIGDQATGQDLARALEDPEEQVRRAAAVAHALVTGAWQRPQAHPTNP